MWKCIHLLSLTNAYVEPKLLSECRMWPSPQKIALYPLPVGPHPPGSQALVYFQSCESALRSHRRLSLSKTVLMLVRAVAWVPSFCGRVVLSLTAPWPLALLCGCAPGLVSHFGCYANILVQILLRHVFMSLRELHLGVELVSCEVGVCLVPSETARTFPKVITLFCIIHQHVMFGYFSSSPMFAVQSVVFTMPVGAQWSRGGFNLCLPDA